jgi:hypothetical protein
MRLQGGWSAALRCAAHLFARSFTERWEGKKAGAPAEAVRVVADELEKLSSLEPVSPEFQVRCSGVGCGGVSGTSQHWLHTWLAAMLARAS